MQKNEQGISQERYKVIPRTLIFITDEERILLIKGSPNKKIWANKFNGIGGHIERGENVYRAAIRELLEETGLKDIPLRFRGSIMIDVEADLGIHLFIFQGKYAKGKLVNNEEGSLHWIPLNNLTDYPLVDDLFTLIPKIVSDPEKMIFGHYYFENNEFMMRFQD